MVTALGQIATLDDLTPKSPRGTNRPSFRYVKHNAYVNSAKRKCLHICHYFMEPEFGLVHTARGALLRLTRSKTLAQNPQHS